jgi:hypothetical protein
VGTEIYLKVGNVVVDWSKNSRGDDHGVLFQEQDRTRIPPDEELREYYAENDIDSEPAERALVRSLRATVPRLELLGFSAAVAEAAYASCVIEWIEYQDFVIEEGQEAPPSPLSFTEFVEFLARHPLNILDDTYMGAPGEEGSFRAKRRFESDAAMGRIPNMEGWHAYSESTYFGSLIQILHPYALLRVLALVPENLDVDVSWHYGPLVDNGWAHEDEFIACARREQKFLIATEGSSDVHILKHAISLLLPEVQDFFSFIDVSDRHPFSGTASLAKFAEGLVKIDVQNRILFLFDNDAEGWTAFEEVRKYKLPSNMGTMILPDHEAFRQFATRGPQGVAEGDINQRAAAIECYLDLRLEGKPPPHVIWTNYKEKREVYQGSLEFKDSYTKAFMKQTEESLSKGTYDVSKLQIVLEHIVRECVAIVS